MTNPIVGAITPDASTVGCRIKVTGANLNSVTKATVGGVDCKFEHVTDSIVIVIVSDDAKSGPVVVSNDDGPAGTAPLFTITVEKTEKKAEVLHHEREAHKEEQVAREEQKWPGKHKKKW